MSNPIEALSEALADAVEGGGRSVVRVEGRRRGAASGVALEGDLVVAALHSVETDEVVIGGGDDARARARVVGRDPSTDIVLLRAERALATPVEWDESPRLRPGNVVVAALRPGRSVRAALGSIGAVGGEWRTPAGGRVDRQVHLDISIQPGISGGLVLAAGGKPVGLATSGLLRSTVMLLPAATVRRVAATLLEHGQVPRGYLGIGTLPVRIPSGAGETGLLVISLEPDAPAAQSGVMLGDAVLSFDGRQLTSPADFMPLLEAERIGADVTVRILRAGEQRELTVRIGTR